MLLDVVPMCYDVWVPKYFDGHQLLQLLQLVYEVLMCCDEVDHVELEYYDELALGCYGVLAHEGPRYCDEGDDLVHGPQV